MKKALIKYTLFSLTGLCLLTLVVMLWVDYEIDQAWGAHTTVVDSQRFAQPQQRLAIIHAQVLAPDGKQMLPAQTLLVEQGRITTIAPDIAVAEDYQVIDGSGLFVVPGLVDSHVHLWQSPNDLLLYLANGVTQVREMNGSQLHLAWRDDIAHGRAGPDLFVASARHNSMSWFNGIFARWAAKMEPISNSTDIPQHVRELQMQGYDAIKIYTELTEPDFRAIESAAKNLKMPLLGHIPRQMNLAQVYSSSLRELAHIEELVKALNREFGGYKRDNTEQFLTFVEQRSVDIAEQLAARQIAVVTTLSLSQSLAMQKLNVAEVLKTVELDYVNPGIAASVHPAIPIMGWLPEVNIYRLPDDYPPDRIAGNQRYWLTYAKAHEILLSALADQGVTLLAGTDANVPVMVPGFSLHDEILALARNGLSNAEALRSATSAPAEWMHINSGRIAPGYQADLLLLRENPLIDVNHTRQIEAVISNGRYYERAQLDAMLAAVKNVNDESR